LFAGAYPGFCSMKRLLDSKFPGVKHLGRIEGGRLLRIRNNKDCDNRFLGRLSLLSLSQFPEGNTLAATEFVRLLEVSGSVTAKRSNGKTEYTQVLDSNSSVKSNAHSGRNPKYSQNGIVISRIPRNRGCNPRTIYKTPVFTLQTNDLMFRLEIVNPYWLPMSSLLF